MDQRLGQGSPSDAGPPADSQPQPELEEESRSAPVTPRQWAADFAASRHDPTKGALAEVPFREFLLRAISQGLCAPIPLLAAALVLTPPPWLVLATSYVALAGAGVSLIVCERLLAKRSLTRQAGSLLLVGAGFMAASIAGVAFARSQLQTQNFSAGIAAVSAAIGRAADYPVAALLLLAAGALPFTILGLIRLRRAGPGPEIGGGCLLTLLALIPVMLLSAGLGRRPAMAMLGVALAVSPMTMLFALGLRLGWGARELLRPTEPTPKRRPRLRASAVRKESDSAD